MILLIKQDCIGSKHKMKLAFTTLGCPDWNLEKIVSTAHELGFDGVEIRGLEGKISAKEIERFQEENRESTKRLFAKNKLELCGFGSSVCFHDPDTWNEMLEEGRQTIDICASMGIPHLRVFGDRIPDRSRLKETQMQIIKGFKLLCEYAAGKSVDILFETHRDFNSIETIGPIVQAMQNESQFGILWDVAAIDMVYGDDYTLFYNTVKQCLRFGHLKDHTRRGDEFVLCEMGEGDIPIKDIVKTLTQNGYEGYLSFEWEKKWHPELPDASEAFPAFIQYMHFLHEN